MTRILLIPTIVPSAACTVAAVALYGKVAVPTGNGAEVVRLNVPPVGLPVLKRSARPRDRGRIPIRNARGGLRVAVEPTVLMIGGSGDCSVIVQSCVLGSKPGTGTFRLGAVEAGISKSMLSGDMTPPTTSLFTFRMACRSEPLPESLVLVTT